MTFMALLYLLKQFQLSVVEWFFKYNTILTILYDCHKTKTKVINLTKHNRLQQHNERIRTRSKPQLVSVLCLMG